MQTKQRSISKNDQYRQSFKDAIAILEAKEQLFTIVDVCAMVGVSKTWPYARGNEDILDMLYAAISKHRKCPQVAARTRRKSRLLSRRDGLQKRVERLKVAIANRQAELAQIEEEIQACDRELEEVDRNA